MSNDLHILLYIIPTQTEQLIGSVMKAMEIMDS